MKKFFAILAIASVMVACNNSAEGEKKATDTAATTPTTETKVDTGAAKVDTGAAKVDTGAAKVDTGAAKK